MANGKLVVLATFSDSVEAALVRNQLVDAGIQALVNNDTTAATLGFTNLSRIEVLVAEHDAEAALEVLRYRDLSLGQIQERTEARHPDGITTPDMIEPSRTDITTPDALEEEEDEDETE
jgi:hypothetical protein